MQKLLWIFFALIIEGNGAPNRGHFINYENIDGQGLSVSSVTAPKSSEKTGFKTKVVFDSKYPLNSVSD